MTDDGRRLDPPPVRPTTYSVTVRRTKRGRWRYRITGRNIGKSEDGYRSRRSYSTQATAWAAAQVRVDQLEERRAHMVTVEESGTLYPTPRYPLSRPDRTA